MAENREQIIRTEYSGDQWQKSYIDYAMSVIYLPVPCPDVRDGLKPVQAHERCMICTSWASAMTGLIEKAPVSWAIPWVSTIPTATAPYMRHWLS